MKMKPNALWLAVATLALPVTATHAEIYTNHIELGVGYVNDDNGKFGEFVDELEDEGTFFAGSVHLGDGPDDNSYQIYLDAGNNRGEVGYVSPGDLKAQLYGSRSQKIEKYNVRTPYPFTSTSVDTANSGSGILNYDVKRHTYGVSLTKYLGKNWSVSADYSHQKKEGNKSFGDHETTESILSAPVDYKHNQFETGVQYNGDRLVVGASYYYSDFSNDHDVIHRFDNGAPAGEIALEPDTDFWRFELDGLYRLGERTNLNWVMNWSHAKQDEKLIGSDANIAPGTKFDGKVKRFNGRLTLASRLTRNFNYKLEYAARHRKADHDPIDLDYRRDTRVFDKDQDTYKAEGRYRFTNRSKLRFGYERDEIERKNKTTETFGGDFAHTHDDTDEDTFWASYKFAPIGKLNLSVKAEHSERDGDQDQYPEWISVYNEDRDRDKYTVNASYPITERAVVTARYSRTDDDFSVGDYFIIEGNNERDPYGMKSRDWESAYVDLTLMPSEDFSISVFVMRDTFEWKRFGWESPKDALGNPEPQSNFNYKSKDETDSYGLTLNWQATAKLKIDADVVFTDSDSKLHSEHYAGLQAGQTFRQPKYDDKNTRLNLVARYQIDPQWSAYARYIYENWDVDDPLAEGEIHDGWGWDADDGATNAFIIGARKSF